MRHHIILLGFLSVLLLSSCDSFLDVKPKGIVIPEFFEDYEKLINGSQIMKSSETFPIYLTDDLSFPDGLNLSQKELAVNSKANLFTFQSEVFGDGEKDALWEGSYNRIYTYNVIIEDVMSVQDVPWEKKKSLQAEALVGRAFEYLNLVNAYGKHYHPATASTDPGVPLVLTKEIIQGQFKRATVQQVYDLIKTDLDTASRYLIDNPSLKAFRATKAAGIGMLARMYLYMGNYDKALEYAKQSLEINSALLDLRPLKVINTNLMLGRTQYPTNADENPENIYIRYPPYAYGLTGAVFVSDELKELYEKYPNDKRKELFITKQASNVTYPNYVWAPGNRPNIAMSTAEMYLIAAECEARVGTHTNAMGYLNKLMEKRITGFIPETAVDKDEALKKVLEERRRELAMFGCSRLIDLKRLNQETRFQKSVVHVTGGKTFTLEPNSPKLVLPVPPKILTYNPDMQPNER